MRLKILTLVIACAVIVPLLQGQNAPVEEIRFASQSYVPDENGTIRVQSTNVDLNVVVRDANGRPVSGLKKDDFQIFDQGKKQKGDEAVKAGGMAAGAGGSHGSGNFIFVHGEMIYPLRRRP